MAGAHLGQGFGRKIVSDHRERGRREAGLSGPEEDPRQQQLDVIVRQPEAQDREIRYHHPVEDDGFAAVNVDRAPHNETENNLGWGRGWGGA